MRTAIHPLEVASNLKHTDAVNHAFLGSTDPQVSNTTCSSVLVSKPTVVGFELCER
jgi:hypothetical protein